MRVAPRWPRSVLIDSGAWEALADVAERNHAAAVAIRTGLARSRVRLYVTNYLVDETYTLMLARLGYRFAVRFLDELTASTIAVVRVERRDDLAAEQLLRRYDDKLFSYTDATSFVVMERLRIDAAFTFDRNFLQYGVNVLPEQQASR